MGEYDKPRFSAGAVNGDMKDSKEIGTKKNAVRALALALLMVGMAQVGYTGGDQLDPLDAERADYTGTITSMVEGAELQLGEAMTPITLNYTSQAGGASFYNGNGSSWLVKDINSGKNSATLEFNGLVLGDYLFFPADDGTNGTELWRSDGTEAGTGMVKDINTGATWDSSSDPYHLTAMGGNIYFAADNGSQSQELWRSDGTESGTVMLMSFIDLGAQSYAFTDPFAIVGDAFYFNANDGTHGRELWKSDGTDAGTVMVKDIRPDYAGNNILDYAVMGDNLYFQSSDNIHGTELWKSDGTESGTVMVKDINTECTSTSCTQTYGSSPQYLTADGETLYFRADDGTHGKELWRSDGTESGTVMVKDIRPDGASSYPLYLTAIGDLVFFRAQGSDENGNDWGIWRSDGTEAGTIALTSSPYAPNGLKAIGDTLFFSLKDKVITGLFNTIYMIYHKPLLKINTLHFF